MARYGPPDYILPEDVEQIIEALKLFGWWDDGEAMLECITRRYLCIGDDPCVPSFSVALRLPEAMIEWKGKVYLWGNVILQLNYSDRWFDVNVHHSGVDQNFGEESHPHCSGDGRV